MQPLSLLRSLRSDMIDYVSSKYPFLENGQTDLDNKLRAIMSTQGSLFQDPVLQLVRTRKPGALNLSEFHPLIAANINALKELQSPFSHQMKAWTRINNNLPTVVSTGTGSGKSESFIVPVINGLLKQGLSSNQKKIGAIFIYPMNALVHDQFIRIFKYTAGTGIKVGIYNGAFKQLAPRDKDKVIKELKSKEAEVRKQRPDVVFDQSYFDPDQIVVNPSEPSTIPHILLTNYKMLEYMLLRSSDQPLFNDMDLKYLVLDEAHTYTGTLALEMSCLLTRLRVHVGEGAKHYLPIATSATLSQGNGEDVTARMQTFFTKLFGKDFPEDGQWLLQDEFEDLPEATKADFDKFTRLDPQEVETLLAQEFPTCLHSLAEKLCGINESQEQELSAKLYSQLEPISKKLAGVLLRNDKGAYDPAVTWTIAAERFKKVSEGDRVHLEALLLLCSHAYKEVHAPALGLRIHAFGKSEPRIFWTLDKKELAEENQREKLSQCALDYVSCRKCGHGAWAGLGVPDNSGGKDRYLLQDLPPFFDEDNATEGEQLFVLHDPSDVNEDLLKDKKSWKLHRYLFNSEGRHHYISPVNEKYQATSQDKILIRVHRTSTNKREASDWASCPACASVSRDGNRPVLFMHRGGPATDLSVYGASLLTHINESEEQKLLVFADNRQETSFLAGFLSDRHRRFHLRRAIVTFLTEAKAASDTGDWVILNRESEDLKHEAHRYEFAIRLLASLQNRKLHARDQHLPKTLVITKSILQSLIPRDVLAFDYRDTEENRTNKDWLLDNFTINDDDQAESRRKLVDEVDLIASDRGRWCLKLLTEVILLELGSITNREGSLQSTGLATWALQGFSNEMFHDYAKSNPELKLDGKGLFLVALWLIKELSEAGQWRGVSPSTARLFLGRHGIRQSDCPKLVELIGKSLGTSSLSKVSTIGRLIWSLGGDEAIQKWASPTSWIQLITQSPFQKYVDLRDSGQDEPRIKTEGLTFITSSLKAFRGSDSPQRMVVPQNLALEGLPTGKNAIDVWRSHELPSHQYYRSLYQRSFNEDTRLIKAQEHNGMLGASEANEAIRKFNSREINTLVATPTLEMGVDLPELPVVVHRSVPPDPSNYAQRAGRAGRKPKRALVVTHCTLGSHDMTFFETPMDMVSGEILPPGIPVENTFIIKRHLNGLVIECMTAAGEGPSLEITDWQKLVNLNEILKEYKRVIGEADGFAEVAPLDWKRIYKEREKTISQKKQEFVFEISKNLWTRDLAEHRVAELREGLLGAAEFDKWGLSFQESLNFFALQAKLYLDDFKRLKSKPRSTGDEEIQTRRAFERAHYLLKHKLGLVAKWEQATPISDLATWGFLPNFDFPGKVTRFIGVKSSFKKDDKSKDSKTLKYERSASVALRELAPEQKVYGQGFIYKIDRYQSGEEIKLGARWGICSAGCDDLTEPDHRECKFCGADLISENSANANRLLPELVTVVEAHGLQADVISDHDGRRNHHRAVQELKRIGRPQPDASWTHCEPVQVEVDLHLSQSKLLETVSVLSQVQKQKSSGPAILHLYKENTDSKLFSVRLERPKGDASQWVPFLPCVYNQGQAIVLRIPYSSVCSQGWVNGGGEEDFKSFYPTFEAVLDRAIHKTLHLNRRNNHLEITTQKILSPADTSGHQAIAQIAILLVDREPGGSGIISLVWDYWNQIMEEAQRRVLTKCCANGCYKCIKSYDNQWDHPLIRKSLLNVEGSAPLFEKLHKEFLVTRNPEQAGLTEVDPESQAAEGGFVKILQAHFSNYSWKAQDERESIRGRVKMIPDFVITSARGKRWIAHVDGYKWHRDILLGDIEKRNNLAKSGEIQLWIPAKHILDDQYKGLIQNFLRDEQQKLSLPASGQPLMELPADVAKETREKFVLGLPKGINGFQVIDKSELKKSVTECGNEIAKALLDCFEKLDTRALPMAIQDNEFILFQANHEIVRSHTMENWMDWLTMISCFNVLGLKPLILWRGARTQGALATGAPTASKVG